MLLRILVVLGVCVGCTLIGIGAALANGSSGQWAAAVAFSIISGVSALFVGSALFHYHHQGGHGHHRHYQFGVYATIVFSIVALGLWADFVSAINSAGFAYEPIFGKMRSMSILNAVVWALYVFFAHKNAHEGHPTNKSEPNSLDNKHPQVFEEKPPGS